MEPETEKDRKNMLRQVGVYSGIPLTMLSTTFVGWLIGNALDKRFHSGGILMFVFVMLGVAAGFYEVYKIIKKVG